MTDILIMISFIMFGIFGYRIMGKVDRFISSDSWRPQTKDKQAGKEADCLSSKKSPQKLALFFHTF